MVLACPFPTDDDQKPTRDMILHHYVKYAGSFNYADEKKCSIREYVDAATTLDPDAVFSAYDMITVTAICLLTLYGL